MTINKTDMQKHSTKLFAAGFALLLLAAGCKRDKVQVYQVSTDQTAPPMAAANAATNSALPPGHPDVSGMSGMSGASGLQGMATAAAPQITWTKPDGWTEGAPTQFRVASFKVERNGKQDDISVVPLPGMAGGDIANVNRWRGQVGLAPASDDEAQKSAETVQIDGQSAQFYDVAGTASRIIAVIQHRDDTTWFFKMEGDAELVEQQKPAFLEFLKSVKFSAASAPAAQTAMPETLPPGHPAIGSMMNAAPASGPISHEGQPNWQVPTDWKEVPAAQFLLAEFSISGADGAKAEVNVAQMGGTGGGLAPNINRWRGQLGLPPSTDASATPLAVNGGDGQLVDITGTDAQTGKPARLVGVIVSQADATWFYKLMGDPAVVQSQKDAFVKFVQSVKY